MESNLLILFHRALLTEQFFSAVLLSLKEYLVLS